MAQRKRGETGIQKAFMKREYRCLDRNTFFYGEYSLVPIRDGDKYKIMTWRNQQLEILRQKKTLTRKEQEEYFNSVVSNLFVAREPKQLLWSFLLNKKLIGYGGLVHIDWESKNAEISFLLATERNNNIKVFKKEWGVYLKMLDEVAFNQLALNKIYTYAYNIRPHYFEVMYKYGYKQEAKLKKHVLIDGKLEDVLILSKHKGK